jgi:hypothetical protein
MTTRNIALRTLALSGAGAFALASALWVATAQAQDESTPAERAATADLNTSASVITHTDAAAQAEYMRAQADYQAKLSAHNAELEKHRMATQTHSQAQATHSANTSTYQSQLNQYQTDRRIYETENALYELDNAIYGDIVANIHDPRFAIVTYPDRFWTVDRLRPAELGGMVVRDRFGRIVGRIGSLQPSRMMVRLDNGRMVWISHPRLRYDVNGRVLVTDLAYNDVIALPVVTY